MFRFESRKDEPSVPMPRVRVVVMQKDEAEALMTWLSHYGTLFGYGNLTIYDNGSTDPRTLYILQHAERLGVSVDRRFSQPTDFHRKGVHFAELVRQWDDTLDYDFALPVDCDELLAVFEDERISIERGAIAAELTRYIGTRDALRLDMSMFNVPGQSGWFSPDRHFHKGFLAARTISHIDNGQHAPKSRFAIGEITTRLTYLHNHNLPYERYIERTRMKLDPLYAHVTDRRELERLAHDSQTPGNHLLRALLRPEAEYRGLYDQQLRIRVGDLWKPTIDLADGKGLIHWNARTYLDLHPDVARHEQGPLHHFIRFGWLEGRDISYMRVA